jgi:transposase
MIYYVGLDVALRSVSACVIDEEGNIVKEAKLDSEVEAIVAWLAPIRSEIEIVGLEAGTLTQYLTYGFQAAGYPIVCMEARGVHAALQAMRNKTDKNDARGIAQILRTGWYRSVHVKSIESHHIRALLSSRKAILNKCIDLENEVRGLFKIFGHKLPPKLKHGAFDGAVRATIEADAALSHALLPLLDARLVLYRTFLEMDRRARKLAQEDEICRRLMTVPGIGAISALTFKAAVDDPKRFKRSRTVGAHFGLTPRRFQSGEMDNMGHISKAGDRSVRIVLYAAANALLTRTTGWSPIKAWGMGLMKTKGRKRALVAVSRKLAVILHRMWVDGTDFQWGTEGGQS